ncbi:MAG TPA: virulence protein, partial [Clostridia bacterium]|nr:virulence protein [Clostridia bacterium]
RCFLLRLGFIGDEYKAARKILLRNLSGSGAFKSGNPKVQKMVDSINSDVDLYDDVMSLQDKEVSDDEVSK